MNKKKIAVVIAAAVLALTLNGCGSEDKSTTDQVVAADNQRIAYAVVTAIDGNEMTYMEVEESQLNLSSDEEDAASGDDATASGDAAGSGDAAQTTDQSQMKENGGGRGNMQMPSGEDSTEQPSMDAGSAPDMSDMPDMDAGSAPDMSDMPDMDSDSAPDRSDMPQMNEGGTETMMPMEEGSTEAMSGGFNKQSMSGTSATVQIPVGVTVHTTSDTNTTFSRIVSGDILEILFETDEAGNEVIVEIWMLQ